ncbi:EAL domain-containing protein [Muricoccus radiodurans]|uniref:EAL domain-containing protein n=1 Tax=Muricoccus radiodurans TaxID=2231721 RepID=UPI003CF3EE5B
MQSMTFPVDAPSRWNVSWRANSPVPRSRQLKTYVIICLVLILGSLAGTTAIIVQKRREAALAVAAADLERLALVAESTMNRQFLHVDGALATLPSTVSSLPPDNAAGDTRLVEGVLRGLNYQTFIFRDLLLLRPDGTPWVTARPASTAWIAEAWRDHISTRRRAAAMSITGPMRNSLTGEWDLFLSRPLTLPRIGRVQAVAQVPVPLLQTVLAPIADVPGLRITLERLNGRVLTTLPHDERRMEHGGTPTLTAETANGRALHIPPTNNEEARIAVSRRTLYDDVFVTATMGQSAALAEWAEDRDRLLWTALALAMLISALGLSLIAVLRHRDRTEAERTRSRIMLENAIESMPDGFVMWDRDDRLVTCNSHYRNLYPLSAPFIQPGVSFEYILRKGAELGEYPQAIGDIEGFVQRTIDWHRANLPPMERPLSNGRWLRITETRTPDGGVVGIRTDVTAARTMLHELEQAHEAANSAIREVQRRNDTLQERDRELNKQNSLFNAALNNMAQGLCMADESHGLIVCNARFLDLFGLEEEIPSGTPMRQVFDLIGQKKAFTWRTIEEVWVKQQELAASARAGAFQAGQDRDRVVLVAQRPLTDGGWVATYEDITERQRAEARVRFMAHHDALTGLPNRVLFRQSMDQALANIGREHRSVALLCIDLDNFKNVNDTLGHPVGDDLLETVSRRLRNCVRESDMVARLGGDEFAVITTAVGEAEEIQVLGRRIISTLSEPYELGGRIVVVGASVGISIATHSGVDADTLMKNADLALYRAKEDGRGTCCLFETDMDLRIQTRLVLEADLRQALPLGQLKVQYQAIVDARTGRATGFEALLRWRHPDRGMISPAEFVPVAEELGLIGAIGAWVLEQACLDAAKLPSHLRMAVNLSPVQLRDQNIVRVVQHALENSGLEPARLELEITETALLQDDATTLDNLHQLRSLGLRIALDDFGTGYSSLSYLRSFPFNKIKIDRSFVGEITERQDCQVIVTSIVDLARNLGISTTAEGVETAEQLNAVCDAGCAEVQGYFFSKPQPLSSILEKIANGELASGQRHAGASFQATPYVAASEVD